MLAIQTRITPNYSATNKNKIAVNSQKSNNVSFGVGKMDYVNSKLVGDAVSFAKKLVDEKLPEIYSLKRGAKQPLQRGLALVGDINDHTLVERSNDSLSVRIYSDIQSIASHDLEITNLTTGDRFVYNSIEPNGKFWDIDYHKKNWGKEHLKDMDDINKFINPVNLKDLTQRALTFLITGNEK